MTPLRIDAGELALRDVARPGAPTAVPSSGASFSDTLARAVASTEALQTEADTQATRVALGGGNLHETALALEKADVAMRLATRVRNKFVEAYQEVMRMSV